MPTPSFLELPLFTPLAMLGRGALGCAGYLGGVGTLVLSALRSVVSPRGEAPPLLPAVGRHTMSILAMGIPLVGLVHIGIGSFLSMQAYFGGTFVDGTGAVVGVGLVRNVAPMFTGLILAGLLAGLYTPELQRRSTTQLGSDHAALESADPEASPSIDPARLAAVRMGAGMIAGLILSVWGVIVGTVVGWQVAKKLLGVSTDSYFSMYIEMLWIRDVVGLVIKGGAFALFGALFSCYEGLRGTPHERLVPTSANAIPTATFRATCLAIVAIMFLNSIWFLLVYHAGPAFGPTLLAPPGL